MDFIDKEHVAFFEVRENGREIAGALDCRTAGRLDVGTHFIGNNRCERCFAQTGRARKQNVIGCLTTSLGRLYENRERLLDLFLAEVVFEIFRAQASVEREIVFLKLCRHGALARIRCVAVLADDRAVGHAARVEHDAFDFDS